jgi:flagellar hook-length control protein FliK
MSALHPLPSAPVASLAKPASASAPSEPGAGDVSFAAVLSAQLGLSSVPELAALVSSARDGSPEDKPLSQPVSDPTALDPSASLSVVPLALPVVSAQVPVIASPIEDGGQEHAAQTGPAFAGGKPLLSAAELALRAQSDVVAKPGQAPSTAAEVPAPASFAAALQALPAGTQDTPGHDHAVGTAEALASSPVPALIAPPSDPRTDGAHRAPPLTTTLPVPMQDSRWGDAFSQRVMWITGQHVQAAEIRIEPPHLGPIEVRISITNDQANLLFTAPHAAARDAIQMSLPRLQEMLLDSGLTLGNVSVGAHTPGDQQARYRDDAGERNSGANGASSVEPLGMQSVALLQRRLGLVDLFA